MICSAAFAASPASTNNDDSCDVKVGPAATLLLPYFEVDVSGNTGQTTLFTVTNVTRYPQIAHVTLWTDYGFPLFVFNIFLTGYDVQGINLADVLIRGSIAPPSGPSPATTPGTLSAADTGNPKLRTPLDCSTNPSQIPQTIAEALRGTLTTGLSTSARASESEAFTRTQSDTPPSTSSPAAPRAHRLIRSTTRPTSSSTTS